MQEKITIHNTHPAHHDSMKRSLVLKALFIALLAAALCTLPVAGLVAPAANATAAATSIMPGSDRDEHGCIPSAGYTWCEPKQKCLREWEEPCTGAAAAATTTEALIGGDRDAHGCIASAGYTWCEPKQKCLREWEEPCTGTAAAAAPAAPAEATAAPATTKSPLPVVLVVFAIAGACALAAAGKKR
jgi:hypothetical protein